MLEILLIVLVVLWLTGNLTIPGVVIPDFLLFNINGHPITLWNVITFLVIVWILGLLPHPFKEIAGVLLILWVLSLLGIIAIAGLTNLIVIGIIVGIVAAIMKDGWGRSH
jgi:hypothetical protein